MFTRKRLHGLLTIAMAMLFFSSCMPAGYNMQDRDCQRHSECTLPAVCHAGDCVQFVCSVSDDCIDPLVCSAGHCQAILCKDTADCPTDWVCDARGACEQPCLDKECGDDGYGNSCGVCASGQNCNEEGLCEGCITTCADKECGDDGCGGVCGTCGNDESCTDGTCVAQCSPECVGLECGDDGCGGSCGSCGEGEFCSAGICESSCVPNCLLNACGEDGCGGVCGECGVAQNCVANLCYSDCITAGSCLYQESAEMNGQGGQISSAAAGAGSATVIVPSGTLSENTTLSISIIEDLSILSPLPDGKTAQGVAYAFEPHGQDFRYPVTISIPFAIEAQSLSLYRLDDVSDDSWEELSGVSFVNGQASFKATSFSVLLIGHDADCAGTVDVDAVIDTCGVCGGDGTSCPGCTDQNACNYDATKTIDDGSCVTCSSAQTCVNSACCTPDCAGKTCGSDGCGGTCGTCAVGESCENSNCVANQAVVLCQEADNVAYTPNSNYVLVRTCTVTTDAPVFVRFKEYISGTQPAPNYNAHMIARNNGESVGAALTLPENILNGPARSYSGSGPPVDAANCNLSPCDNCAPQWAHCHCPQPYEIIIRDVEAGDVLELWVTAADESNNMAVGNAQPVYVRDFEVETCVPNCVDNLCQDDGCGGVCATCADNGYCDADDNCAAATCIDDGDDCNIVADGGFESLQDVDGPLTVNGSSVHVGPTVIGEWTAFHRRYGFYGDNSYSCATVSMGGALVSAAGGGTGELVASLSSPGSGPSASGCQGYLYRKIGVPEFDPLNDVLRLKFSSKVAASGTLLNLYASLNLHSDVSALPHNDDPDWYPIVWPSLGVHVIYSYDTPLTGGIVDWPATPYNVDSMNGYSLSSILAPYRGREIVVSIMISDGDTNAAIELWIDDVALVIDEN